jgi:putative PIN family toxin of toxin-antitoxin system
MKVLLDTYVVVSALLSPNGAPAGVLNLVLDGKAILVFDNAILAEYDEVLRRARFRIDNEFIDTIIDFIKAEGEFAISLPQGVQLIDEEDQPFYDLHKSARTDFLVTGNIRHFPQEAGIVTPRDFLDTYLRHR